MVSLPRFGSLWAFGPTAHWADAPPARLPGVGADSRSLNRRGGRWPRPPLVSLPTFGSLWAFGPTAHRADAPLRCPKTCAAAQNVSVSSGRRSQETRVASISMGCGACPARNARGGASRRGADGVTGAAECGRRDEPGCRDANTGTERGALARVASRRRRSANGGTNRDVVTRTLGRSAGLWREWRDGNGGKRTAGSERRDEPGCRDANTGTECEALARVA